MGCSFLFSRVEGRADVEQLAALRRSHELAGPIGLACADAGARARATRLTAFTLLTESHGLESDTPGGFFRPARSPVAISSTAGV
jgi:hypothetical protein